MGLIAAFGGAIGIARILAILGPLSYIAYVAHDFKSQAVTITTQAETIKDLRKDVEKLTARNERVDARRSEHLELLNHYREATKQAGCSAKVEQIVRDRQNAAHTVFDPKEGQ